MAISVLAIIAVLTNREKWKRDRGAFRAFVTDIRLKGLVKTDALTFWIEPSFGFVPIAIVAPYIAFAMLFHRQDLTPEVQLSEVAWMVPLVLLSLYFHLRRTSHDRLDVVEPGSVTIINGCQGVVTELHTMAWGEMRFKIGYDSESDFSITMDGPKGVVSVGRHYPNFDLLCELIFKHAPERVPYGGGARDELEKKAAAGRGRNPVYPWSETDAS